MHLPNGSQIFIGEQTTPADIFSIKKMESVSNQRDEIKVTTTATVNDKIAAGDYVMFTECNWHKLTNVMVRVKSVEENGEAFTVKGFNASDKNSFPAMIESPSGDNGKVTKYDRWIEIPCVQDLSQDGGEQQFYTYQCLSDDREQQLPTFKSATNVTYTFAWDFENSINDLLRELDDSGAVVPMRMFVPRANEMRMWTAVLSFNDIPQTTMNEMETVSLSASIKGRFVSVKADMG